MQIKKKISKITQEVNKVYSEKNPSTYFRDNNEVAKFIKNRENFLLKLKLPKKLFHNSTLIDFGCGMGQNTLVYDHLGSECTLIEFDKHSYISAKKLFKGYAKNFFKTYNTDLFNYKLNKKYDFVVSNGVIHHTKNPQKNLKICADALMTGGFLILGIGNKSGFFQRNLQRFILYSLSNNNNDIIKYSKILFKEHLKRSVKYSGRSSEEIIFDTYINPRIFTLGTQEIMNFFSKNNISLYSSYDSLKEVGAFLEPNTNQFKLKKAVKEKTVPVKKFYFSDFEDISLSNNKTNNLLLYDNLNSIMPIFNKITDTINNIKFNDFQIDKTTMIKDIKDYKKNILSINKIDLINKNHNKIFLDEVTGVLKILNKNKNNYDKFIEIKNYIDCTKKLFKLVNGVGMNYYVGYKNE